MRVGEPLGPDFEPTVNRPIFRRESNESAGKIVRNRQPQDSQSSGRGLGPTTGNGPRMAQMVPNNISPSRYIHTSDAETYRPIAEIVEELKVIDLSAAASAKAEAEARETDNVLKEILKQLGVGA